MTESEQANKTPLSVVHPVAAASELGAEVQSGRSWRTPFLALGGTALMVAAAVVVIVALAFAAYYLAK